MRKIAIATMLTVAAVTCTAEVARGQDDRYPVQISYQKVHVKKVFKHTRHIRHVKIDKSLMKRVASKRHSHVRIRQVSLKGVVAPLAHKISEIVDKCKSEVISTIRHTLVAGTTKPSLHNYGEAVDVRGNYTCIYGLLAGWPGGYSTDPGRVHHVHISYEPHGREWGARFAHGVHRRYAHRRMAHRASLM